MQKRGGARNEEREYDSRFSRGFHEVEHYLLKFKFPATENYDKIVRAQRKEIITINLTIRNIQASSFSVPFHSSPLNTRRH